jgi:hypothetical protein
MWHLKTRQLMRGHKIDRILSFIEHFNGILNLTEIM